MHWNRTVEPISPLIIGALVRLLERQQSAAEASSSSVALRMLSFDCMGTLKLVWKKRQDLSSLYTSADKWHVEYWLYQPNTLDILLQRRLVVSQHFVGLHLHMGDLPIGTSSTQQVFTTQLLANTSLLTLRIEPPLREALVAFYVGRNRVRSLAMTGRCRGLWARALFHFQQEGSTALLFLALRHGFDKFHESNSNAATAN